MERMNPISIKIEFENSLRRATIHGNDSLAAVKATVSSLIGVRDCEIKYVDEDGDLILVGSDQELRELLGTSQPNKTLRIIVTELAHETADDAPSASDAYEEEEERTFPFEAAARALSDKENVANVLAHFQSDALIDAVTSAASTYVESGGDFSVTAAAAGAQLASLQALVLTVVSEIPELKELLLGVMSSSFTEMFSSHRSGHHHHHHRRGGSCGPHRRSHSHGCSPHRRPHCPGGHGKDHCRPHHRPCHPHRHPHHCQPDHSHHHHPHHHHDHSHHHYPHHHHDHSHHHHSHHQPDHSHQKPCRQQLGEQEVHDQSDPNCKRWQKHPFVVCDGCDSDNALKQASIINGHQTRRGFIAGERFKSQTVDDFDLCESCKACGRFPEATYGPFAIVPAPLRRHFGLEGRRRGCGNWRPAAEGERGNWRGAPSAEHSASEPNQQGNDLIGMMRKVLSGGVEAASGASNEEVGAKVTEFTKALAESFKFKGDSEVRENSSPDGWVPVASQDAAEETDPFMKWSAQLQQLQTLGFNDVETYIELLEEARGDLDQVVNRIVQRDS